MSSERRSSTIWIVGGAIIVIALIGAVVVGLTRSDDDDGGDPTAVVETNAVEIDGTPLPALTSDDPALDSAFGAPAPTRAVPASTDSASSCSPTVNLP